jgi:hypothetical protein
MGFTGHGLYGNETVACGVRKSTREVLQDGFCSKILSAVLHAASLFVLLMWIITCSLLLFIRYLDEILAVNS